MASTIADIRDSGALSGPLAGVSFIIGVAGAMTLADAPYPRPGADPAEIRRYFNGNPDAARISVVGQLISAVSLVRFTVSVAKLASRSGRRLRGLRAAAVAGGGLAATSLATSALCAAARPGCRGEQDASAAELHRLMFAADGPVHGAGFGALVGALGLAGLRTVELPRPLAIAGLVSAVAGMLSDDGAGGGQARLPTVRYRRRDGHQGGGRGGRGRFRGRVEAV